mmetsp:Transcript_18236/g.33040  ORF Transcript_18236/g.33040 Transcript_18236/m.33040 type:complete len:551 (+) Transcript_18236:134-1786(+)|eukprot:CAMPEP_0202485936 /NCGR_PEP_ID=MMETSP1361-20130828/4622_1 /ASSEMBLY_ACC=CAM_ASM_000849 /TAXON_ID=210615 /ORGANISM="Staurosira complex sp., Strain CCMP2646" /LENGTH=550 /DNA_ID=CAMNT_0049114931 /DNA_START=459 /DNA_END=2107 /DNA_ORIENTATION=+
MTSAAIPTKTAAGEEEHHVDTLDEILHEEEATAAGCGILGRYPLISVISFAALGLACGIGLSFWEPDDDSKDKAIKWIGLIGVLFIRALKCVILPLVFINVIISVVDMMSVGRAGSVGWKTIVAYTVTTLIASVLGIIAILIFEPLFATADFPPKEPPMVLLGCTNTSEYLTEFPDGNVGCAADVTSEEYQYFYIEDLSGSFVRTEGSIASEISLSDTVYEGVFMKLITDNAVFAFTDANFAAVVVMAICFGIALSGVMLKEGGEAASHLLPVFKEIDACLLKIINWIIMITPFAVFSLIASAVGAQADLGGTFENVAYLVLACCFGFIMQFLLVHGLIFWFVTKMNPLWYFKHIIPAQTMAFACASSAATIPVTLRSVRSTGVVPESILKFVVPLGATINMDGSAIYFPCACVWLAVLNGVEVNAAHYILLIIIATIGSAGTAPVPASGLVLIVTAYNTVFGTSGIPNGFSFVVAIDWFLDRLITVVNVSGDASVCGMISKLCPMDDSIVLHDKTLMNDDSNDSSAHVSQQSEEVMMASDDYADDEGTA